MKRAVNIYFTVLMLLPACVFAANNPSQKALPDNMMEWMSERYNAKTMLGFKWKNPAKARLNYALARNNHGVAGISGSPAAKRGPGARLDIIPYAGFYAENAWENKTNSYLEARYSKPGRGASWNAGYIKYSETRYYWTWTYGDQYRKTDAGVLFTSLLLTLPIKSLSYYAYGGPALASYDNEVVYPGVSYSKKSGTIATWIAGIGWALSLSDTGFGVFAEYKHMPETGDFAGMDNFGLGFSLGF